MGCRFGTDSSKVCGFGTDSSNVRRFGTDSTNVRQKFVDSVPIRQKLVESVPIGSEFRTKFFIGKFPDKKGWLIIHAHVAADLARSLVKNMLTDQFHLRNFTIHEFRNTISIPL